VKRGKKGLEGGEGEENRNLFYPILTYAIPDKSEKKVLRKGGGGLVCVSISPHMRVRISKGGGGKERK